MDDRGKIKQALKSVFSRAEIIADGEKIRTMIPYSPEIIF